MSRELLAASRVSRKIVLVACSLCLWPKSSRLAANRSKLLLKMTV
jgi:hypothetical protein